MSGTDVVSPETVLGWGFGEEFGFIDVYRFSCDITRHVSTDQTRDKFQAMSSTARRS
jgi:hypothetical protein